MQGRVIRFLVTTLAALMLAANSPALASAEYSMYDYGVKQWTAQDGLSSQSVKTIAQDRMGYIWVGSLFGLNRFDGSQFNVFRTQNEPKLVSNGINKLHTDASGYLWIGTKSGLSGVDPTNLQFSDYPILSEVTDIVETADNRVLVAAGGLFKIVDKMSSKIKTVQGNVRKIAVADDGIWVITDSHLYLLNNDSTVRKQILLSARVGQSIIHGLHWNKEDGLLVATDTGAYYVNDQYEIEQENLPVGQEIPVYKLLKDSRGGAWLSAFGSLYYRGLNRKWQPVVAEQLGHSPWFSDIFEDRSGNIWLASNSDGLWRASISEISRHVPDNLPSRAINSVSRGPKGKLWLGTQRGVGTLDKNGNFELVIPANVLHRQKIYGLAFHDGKVLLATESGLMVYQGDRLTVPRPLEPIQWSNIRAISPALDGNLWIGTSQGLYYYDHQRLLPFRMNGRFISKNITYVLEREDSLWIGTYRGAWRYDKATQKIERLGLGKALFRSYVTSILDLGKRGVLISTLDDGLFYQPVKGKWRHYDESSGLANGVTVALHYIEEQNMIWVSTLKGVYRFEVTQLERHGDNIQIQSILSPFDRQLGTRTGRCCTGIGHQKIADFMGSLWFPSSKGVVEIPKDIDPFGNASDTLTPIIQRIVTANSRIVIGEQNDFQLDLNERDFTVSYSALNYKLPDAQEFRYKLEGYDSTWKFVGKRREAVYTNLPSGEFTFKVQSRLPNEDWNAAKQASIVVKLPMQFSETVLYRILVGVMIMLILYVVMLLIRNRERRKRQTLRELVDQRTEELQLVNAQLNEANQQLKQLSHKDELSGLRNRHFVFEQLPKDIEHYQRNRESLQSQGKSFALIVINIDGFKHINDSHGPIAGDSVLTQFAVLLTRETRGSDYVVRWGGDEFLIVLRDSQANQIESFIYEMNLAVSSSEFHLPDGQSLSLTCSIGYALYPLPLIGGQLINWEVSLSLADMALHQVKNAGRNGWATVEFDEQVDAFEFEDNDALESFVEQLFATGAARFNLRLADNTTVE